MLGLRVIDKILFIIMLQESLPDFEKKYPTEEKQG
jgi:hypothetical protein